MADTQTSATTATTEDRGETTESARTTPAAGAKQTKPVGQRHWDMDTDIPWDRFEPGKVDPELLKIIKAASLVEYNARDYAQYLCNVFDDDPAFQEEARAWAHEEVQHGGALGRWCEHADPDWDHTQHFERFVAGFRPDVDASQSIRGSRAGELVARCMVEVGTSSYYGSLGAATDEPVLKEICKRIAGDELRHYKMFYANMKRYLEVEHPSKLQRFRVAIGRVLETEDDELSYAYYAANAPADAPYKRDTYNKAYMRRAFQFYHPKQIERAVSMTWKASGFNPQSRVARMAARGAWWFVRHRASRLAKAGV
jgi:rubrerythrin